MLIFLAGCTVGPEYRKHPVAVPHQWSQALPEDTGPAPAAVDLKRWWTVFKDPRLDSLIARAVENNQDLRLADARIREARAQRSVVAADIHPSVGTSAIYTRSRRSESSPALAGLASAGAVSSPAQDLFQAGFDAGWELDVFGGIRRAVEAADADIGASIEARRDILVILLSEVARSYLEVRGNQLRIAIARENGKAQMETLEMTVVRLEAGLGSELQVAQAQAQLASTQAQVPALEGAARQAIHRLGVLLGMAPQALLSELTPEALLPETPPRVPVGLPSELLRRRPDIRRAERELAAATAAVGVATADLFPRFSLTGALGLQGTDAGDLARIGSRFWSIGPSIRFPVFDAGRIRAAIQVRDARQEQALVRYEQTILQSLEDVENALVAYSREWESRHSLSQRVDANQRAVEIAGELYSKGLVDFLNVLDSQRSLYQAQDALAQSDQRVSTGLVALFKALGGGWDEEQMENGS